MLAALERAIQRREFVGEWVYAAVMRSWRCPIPAICRLIRARRVRGPAFAIAAKGGETFRAHGPIRRGAGDPTAGPQRGLGAGQFMRRRTDVHPRVVQDEILEGHELAGEPKTRAGVLEMSSADPALNDRARPRAFVEPGERVFRGRERT